MKKLFRGKQPPSPNRRRSTATDESAPPGLGGPDQSSQAQRLLPTLYEGTGSLEFEDFDCHQSSRATPLNPPATCPPVLLTFVTDLPGPTVPPAEEDGRASDVCLLIGSGGDDASTSRYHAITATNGGRDMDRLIVDPLYSVVDHGQKNNRMADNRCLDGADDSNLGKRRSSFSRWAISHPNSWNDDASNPQPTPLSTFTDPLDSGNGVGPEPDLVFPPSSTKFDRPSDADEHKFIRYYPAYRPKVVPGGMGRSSAHAVDMATSSSPTDPRPSTSGYGAGAGAGGSGNVDKGGSRSKRNHKKRRKKSHISSISGITPVEDASSHIEAIDANQEGPTIVQGDIQDSKLELQRQKEERIKEMGRRYEMFPGVSRRLIRTKKLAKNLIKGGINSAIEMAPVTMRPRSGTLFSQLAVLKRKKKYDRTPHDIFVQLDQFVSFNVGDGQGLWLEKARWIKYEENMDWEGPLRWGKPHVPFLSFHSLLDLRQQLITGTMIFDLKCDDYESFVTYVTKMLLGKSVISEGEVHLLKQTLFAPHKFPHTSQYIKFMAVQNWLSTVNPQWGAPLFSSISPNRSSNDVLDQGHEETERAGKGISTHFSGFRRSSSTPAFHRQKRKHDSGHKAISPGSGEDNRPLTNTEISPSSEQSQVPSSSKIMDGNLDTKTNRLSDCERGYQSSDSRGDRARKNNSDPAVRASFRPSLAFLRFGNLGGSGAGGVGGQALAPKIADVTRRIPKNSEAASIMVGTVPYLNRPLCTFVRLVEPVVVKNLKGPPPPPLSQASTVVTNGGGSVRNSSNFNNGLVARRSVPDTGTGAFKKHSRTSHLRTPESNGSTSLLEVPSVPVRFIFILLGPQTSGRQDSADNHQNTHDVLAETHLGVNSAGDHHNDSVIGSQDAEIDYYDLGRCFSTLMANKFFQDIAYQATHCRELILAFNEFLNESVVLPAGELNANTLLPLTRLYKDRMLKNLPKPHHHPSEAKKTSRSSSESASAQFSTNKKATDPQGNPARPPKHLCPLFKGLREDIKAKKPWYFSDFRDAANSTCLLAVLFIYLTSMPPSVTFGGLLSEKTDNWIGVSEIMVADCIGGIVFALFGGQPLMLLTVTGPLLVFEESLYQFTKRYSIDYISFRFWMGIWVAIITVCFVAFDGTSLIKYFTRFIEEIFALTIALVFIYEVMMKIYKLFYRHPLYQKYCQLTLSDKKIENKSFVAFQKNLMLTDSYLPIQRGTDRSSQLNYRYALDESNFDRSVYKRSQIGVPDSPTTALTLAPVLVEATKERPKLYYYKHEGSLINNEPSRNVDNDTTNGAGNDTSHPISNVPGAGGPMHQIFYRGSLRRFYNYYYGEYRTPAPRTKLGHHIPKNGSLGSDGGVLFFYTPLIRYHDIDFGKLYSGVARAPDGHLILDRDYARCKVIRPNTALFSTLLVLATFFAAFFLRRFRREGKFLTRTLRRTLGDFGPPIALLASACVDTYGVGLDVYTEKLNLHSGPPASPTLPDRRGWLVHPMGQVSPITLNMIGLAVVPAAMLFILLFIEGQLTALLVNKRQRKLRKSHGYHLDLLVTGLLQIPMGVLGLPWISPAPIQSLAHVACLSIYNTREHVPGDRPTVLEVKEQRVTNLLISVAMGLTLLFGSSQLQKIPVASLFGVFLYLGVSSLTGIQFWDRLTLLITSPKYYPRSTNAAYIRKISYPKIHLYTLIQFSCLALLWALKFTPLSLFFPLVLLSIVPLRFRLGCLFSKQELYYLDMEEEEASEDEFDFYTEAHMPV